VTQDPWHAPDDVLTAFARSPRSLDDNTAASVEAHLAACASCRVVVAAAADASVADQSWAAIVDTIDRPRSTIVERVLGRFLPPHAARLVAATPTLQAAWGLAVIAIAAGALAASHALDSDSVFVVLAPFVPLVGVALAFAPGADPAGEAALATPAHGAGVVAARTMSVVATTVPVLLLGSLLLPHVDARAVAWLLPSLALIALASALSTWWTPRIAAAATSAAWGAAIVLVARLDGISAAIARSSLFGAVGQTAFASVLACAVLVAVARRDNFRVLEAR
jgi:hypothetical protein